MMIVGRTGAKRGVSPTWYVSADLAEEQAAIRAGLLEERSPDARWRFVLAWGLPSRATAEDALARLRPAVAAAVAAAVSALEARADDAARGTWSAETAKAEELLAVARPAASWAREWAALAERAGWPCWGMSWGEWTEDVARVVRGQYSVAEQAGGLQQLAITGI